MLLIIKVTFQYAGLSYSNGFKHVIISYHFNCLASPFNIIFICLVYNCLEDFVLPVCFLPPVWQQITYHTSTHQQSNMTQPNSWTTTELTKLGSSLTVSISTILMLPIVSWKMHHKHLNRQRDVCYYLYEVKTIVMIKEQYLLQPYHQIFICWSLKAHNTSHWVIQVNIPLGWGAIFIVNKTAFWIVLMIWFGMVYWSMWVIFHSSMVKRRKIYRNFRQPSRKHFSGHKEGPWILTKLMKYCTTYCIESRRSCHNCVKNPSTSTTAHMWLPPSKPSGPLYPTYCKRKRDAQAEYISHYRTLSKMLILWTQPYQERHMKSYCVMQTEKPDISTLNTVYG